MDVPKLQALWSESIHPSSDGAIFRFLHNYFFHLFLCSISAMQLQRSLSKCNNRNSKTREDSKSHLQFVFFLFCFSLVLSVWPIIQQTTLLGCNERILLCLPFSFSAGFFCQNYTTTYQSTTTTYPSNFMHPCSGFIFCTKDKYLLYHLSNSTYRVSSFKLSSGRQLIQFFKFNYLFANSQLTLLRKDTA